MQGWELVTDISGRFLVALPQNGTAGASFGGPAIDQGSYQYSHTIHNDMNDYNTVGADQAQHNHTAQGYIELTSTPIELASGCCADGYAGAGLYDYATITAEDPTNIPFVLLPMCQQT